MNDRSSDIPTFSPEGGVWKKRVFTSLENFPFRNMVSINGKEKNKVISTVKMEL